MIEANTYFDVPSLVSFSLFRDSPLMLFQFFGAKYLWRIYNQHNADKPEEVIFWQKLIELIWITIHLTLDIFNALVVA